MENYLEIFKTQTIMIRSINLDSMFQPTVFPEIEFSMVEFSGGELHPKLNPYIDYTNVEKVVITHRVNNSKKLIEVLLVADALKLMGIKNLDLIMPYIPYARQDRYDSVANFGESFSLKVFANLLNAVNFDTIYVLDPHSDVSTALINNIRLINSLQYINRAYIDLREVTKLDNDLHRGTWFISPDSGANKKANKLYSNLIKVNRNPPMGLIKCDKVRDVHTGKITGFEVFADDLLGYNCLLVDDICDGGATFIGLAEELKNKNAGDLFLYVNHGIFSKGTSVLAQQFSKIYTTNSIDDFNEKHLYIKQFKIEL